MTRALIAYRERLGSEVRRARKAAEVSIAELADHLGIDTSVMTRIETGKISVTAERLDRIAAYVKVEPACFMSAAAQKRSA